MVLNISIIKKYDLDTDLDTIPDDNPNQTYILFVGNAEENVAQHALKRIDYALTHANIDHKRYNTRAILLPISNLNSIEQLEEILDMAGFDEITEQKASEISHEEGQNSLTSFCYLSVCPEKDKTTYYDIQNTIIKLKPKENSDYKVADQYDSLRQQMKDLLCSSRDLIAEELQELAKEHQEHPRMHV